MIVTMAADVRKYVYIQSNMRRVYLYTRIF